MIEAPNGRYDLLIETDVGIYRPLVLDGVELTQERKGAPSTLNFTVIKDDLISFPHGAKVQFNVDGKVIFVGRIFTKTRDKKHHIKCTAYDQLRYLKNKDSRLYDNRTATDIITWCAQVNNLRTDGLCETNYTLRNGKAINKTYFDMIQDALDATVINTGNLYVLYDDAGYLKLKNIKDMEVDYLLDDETCENFDYNTTIDNGTYNYVEIQNKTKSGIDTYTKQNDENIKAWGKLKYFAEVQNGGNPQEMANMILKIANEVQRTLTVKGCFGDTKVRAGSLVLVNLHLGDKIIDNRRLMCEKVVHNFKNDHYTMDLTLSGNKWLQQLGSV